MMKKIYFLYFLFSFTLYFPQTQKSIDEQYKTATKLFHNKKKEEALKITDKIIESAVKINYSKGKALGYMHRAYYYYLKREFNISLENIRLIEQEDYFKNNKQFQAYVYDLLAQVYLMNNLEDDAIKTFKKVASLSRLGSNSKAVYRELIAYTNLVHVYSLRRINTDSINYYNTKAYNLLINTPNRNDTLNVFLAKTAMTIGMMYKQQEAKKDSSEYYLKKSMEYIPKHDLDPSSAIILYQFISTVYLYNGKYEEAKKYNDLFTKYAENTEDLNHTILAHKASTVISDITKSPTAYEDLKKYNKTTETIALLDNQNKGKSIKQLIQNKKQEVEKKNEFSRYLLLLIIVILLFSIFGIYYTCLKIKKRHIEKKKLLLEKQSEISKLESQMNVAFDEIVSLAKENSPNFLIRFQEVYPGFCERIMTLFPDTQSSELTFCAYLWLNFSTKDIANCTFVTPKTVQMRKYRLRKKFNIPSDQDIYMWMKNIGES